MSVICALKCIAFEFRTFCSCKNEFLQILSSLYDYFLFEEYLGLLDVYHFLFLFLVGLIYYSSENIFLRLSGSIGLIIIDILMFYLYKLYFTCHFYTFQDSRIDFIYSYNVTSLSFALSHI